MFALLQVRVQIVSLTEVRETKGLDVKKKVKVRGSQDIFILLPALINIFFGLLVCNLRVCFTLLECFGLQYHS